MIDVEEIKRLPDDEKLKIVDAILDSMSDTSEEDDEPVDEQYDMEVANLLNERLAAYHRGESQSYSWEEVKERLRVIREKIQQSQHA